MVSSVDRAITVTESSSASDPHGARIALLLPDGVGVRNFVFGPFLEQIRRSGPILALHCIPADVLQGYGEAVRDGVEWQPMVLAADTLVSLTLRKALSFAHMYQADTIAMRYRRSLPVTGSRRARTMTRAARLAGRTVAAVGAIRWLDRFHWSANMRLPAVRYYQQLFRRQKPAVLFSSSQQTVSAVAPVLAARSCGIPTAAFIFSWDNVTTKGRIAAPFDHFLVWSEYMKAELLRVYPEVSPERVHIVGTPQFDPYADESLIWPREEFFRRIGGDPLRSLICYSGGDAGTCPEDPGHVGVLMGLIRTGRIAGNPQVVLRPMPVDNEARYDEVRKRYPELLYARPAWVHAEADNWARVVPLPDDIQFLANLTRHADMNINVASTMTLDFAIHEKPVVNVAFDVADPPPLGISVWDLYYQWDHYRPVVELGAARIARSPAELADHVNAYLKDPSLDAAKRRRLIELEVRLPLGHASERIAQTLAEIATESR